MTTPLTSALARVKSFRRPSATLSPVAIPPKVGRNFLAKTKGQPLLPEEIGSEDRHPWYASGPEGARHLHAPLCQLSPLLLLTLIVPPIPAVRLRLQEIGITRNKIGLNGCQSFVSY